MTITALRRLRRGAAVAGLLLTVLLVGGLFSPGEVRWPAAVLVPAVLWGIGGAGVGHLLLRSVSTWCSGALWSAGGLVLLAASLAAVGWLPPAVGQAAALTAGLLVLPAACLSFTSGGTPVVAWTALPSLGAASVVAVAAPHLAFDSAVVATIVLIGGQWWRLEHLPAAESRSARWLAAGLGAALLVVIPTVLAGHGTSVVVGATLASLLALTSAVLGAAPPDRADFRTLAGRGTALVITLVVALALFRGAAAVLTWSTGRGPTTNALAGACVLVAVGFEPMRRLLVQAVDRLLFGDHLDPVGAASSFAAELESGTDLEASLRALRRLLQLPAAVIRGERDGSVVAASGRVVAGTAVLPLLAGGQEVGWLELGLRPGEDGLTARDRPVLRIVAPALAQTLRSQQLLSSVQSSRERVVEAVEADRKRLRGDLHDGVGPALTGIAYAADAALNLLASDAPAAAALIAGLRTDAGNAIEEVRRLVAGLGPAVLDQVGLVAALRQRSRRLLNAQGQVIEVRLDVADPLPPLTAAAEVAVFRVVTEALTNVARHSRSTLVEVALQVRGEALAVDICDRDGRRAPAVVPPLAPTDDSRWTPGVGLTSMQERAEQLGGSLEFGPADGGGRVILRLPLPPRTMGSPATAIGSAA